MDWEEGKQELLIPVISGILLIVMAALFIPAFYKDVLFRPEVVFGQEDTPQDVAGGNGERQGIHGLLVAFNDARIQKVVARRKEITTMMREVGSTVVNLNDITLPSRGEHYADIVIERVGMNVPLYLGDDYALLDLGAGQYADTGTDNMLGFGSQILIAGHNVTDFAPLEQAELGDMVEINSSYGDFTYEITDMEVVQETDTSAYNLNLDREQVILYTCYPFGCYSRTPTRYFVYCDKISGPSVVE